MADIGIVGFLLVLVNVVVSYKGFRHSAFFDNYKFEVDKILVNNEYQRLVTSGFLHVSWTHLVFNMMSLYAFSTMLESEIGSISFLIVYFGSLVGGDLLALFVHRNHGDYTAVGASGAVCGVVFASIALFPEMRLSLFGVLPSIPSWLYGIGYIGYSIYGIKSKRDNIGHEAHLGGALVGMVLAAVIRPEAFLENYLVIAVVVIPTVLFIYLIMTNPGMLLVDNFFFNQHNGYTIDDRYNERKLARQRELDRLLDKINAKGIDSLSARERQKLEEYSK